MRDHRGLELRGTFESLYTSHYQEIAAYVRRRVADREADDVIAQVFVVAWRRIERVPTPPADRLCCSAWRATGLPLISVRSQRPRDCH